MRNPANTTDSATTTARVLWVGAVALIVFGVAELLFLGASSRVLALRLGWAVLLAAAAFAVRRAAPRARAVLLAGVGAISPLLFAALLVLRYDLSGVSFAFFLSTPLVFAILLRGEVGAVSAAAASTVLVGGGLFRWLPGHTGDVVAWVIGSAAAGSAAIYSAVLFRRMALVEAELQEERFRLVELRAREARTRAAAERGLLLSQVAAGLAHEINNPLAAITANLHFIESATQHDQDGERDEIVEAIHESSASATRIADVIRRIKALTSDLSSERGTCEPVTVVRSLVDEAARPARLMLVDRMPPSMPPVAVATDQLRRVVLQVLRGALDALSAAPSPQLMLEARIDERFVELVITDNARVSRAPATGGNHGALELRARGKDSGLGLTLAGESCRQWGGDVVVTAAALAGEEVVLRLPRADAPPQ